MKTTGQFSRSTRLEKSIAALEAELAGKRIAPTDIEDDFIDTTDASNFEERLAQLSPELRQLIEDAARDNVLAFDSIIADRVQRKGYLGGWTALRDWARRQPWHAEAVERVKAIMARWPSPSPLQTEAEPLTFSEQGRMLGILRVERMRATTDEERDVLTKQIEELEAAFKKANHDSLDR